VIADDENGNLCWRHTKSPSPFLDFVVLERKIDRIFVCYSGIKHICFHFMTSDSLLSYGLHRMYIKIP
jgi:hypothetical protein